MSKYLELVEGSFNESHFNKQTSQNPYVAYSIKDSKVIYTIIPKEPTSVYQMVDLGLSVKWADRNVGAENPWDNGAYFSWGNVDGHTVGENGYTTDDYSFDKNTYATTLGGLYTGSELDAEHDAATVNMGSEWRMPTIVETSELVENTDHYYIGEDGKIVVESDLSSSKKLRSICFVKKGTAFDYNDRSNFIEFPFAGDCSSSLLDREGLYCSAWSSSVYEFGTSNARCLGFYSSGTIYGNTAQGRLIGKSIRGVQA